ncbi:MAG: SpoIIE family protein phosphatase [Balneolaceae bacterium]|nr:SpoIIE family protein phosphatase [Balneolaceae bacterium]
MDLYLQIFFSTLAVSFGILHLFLYLYNKDLKSNLYFASFLFLYALNIFFDYQASLVESQAAQLYYLKWHRAVMPYSSLFALLFIYYAFDFNIPKYYWALAAALVITGLFAILDPVDNYGYVQIPLILMIIEAVRVFYAAIRKNRSGAWILTGGFILLFLFSSYDLLMDIGLISPVAGIGNGYPFGFLFLILFSSAYLARDFAQAHQTILQQEREAREMEIAQKLLEAEDKRKEAELLAARDVQLSLLPHCEDNLGNYSFCFDMRPATEVGGDYYDYKVADSGEISVAIGDATGHGMKAGMMVAIMKSLFLSQAEGMEISDFLNTCSQTIKRMDLENLYMAFMLVKLDGRNLAVSSAGIPPILIYRNTSDTIEEIKTKGMPLGAVESFPYQTAKTELEVGDVVLLMTDGLTELFNDEREQFGIERLKETFRQHAGEPVDRIVDRLISAGKDWLDGKQQDDDMTFISFRRHK